MIITSSPDTFEDAPLEQEENSSSQDENNSTSDDTVAGSFEKKKLRGCSILSNAECQLYHLLAIINTTTNTSGTATSVGEVLKAAGPLKESAFTQRVQLRETLV